MLTHPFCSLQSKRGIEEERETAREGLFVRFQEQSGLEATAGQPGPQREKKRAFNMGTGLLTSAHRGERTERERRRKRKKKGLKQPA